MRGLVIATCLLLAGPPSLQAGEAEPVESHDCRAFARSTPEHRTWWTIYYGERDRTVAGADIKEWTREVRCFASADDCRDWLKWARTVWPDRGFSRPCRNGLPPWLSGPET